MTEQLWELLSGKLKQFFRARVHDEQVAEDLLQETFLRILQGLDSVKDTDKLSAWVFQIARNLLVDHYRYAGRQESPIEIDIPEAQTFADNENEVVVSWLPSFIDRLPASQREAVRLYELQGVSQQEIADRMGVSLSGTKSRVQRGREKLKEMLHRCCSFELDRRGNILGYQCRDHPPDEDNNRPCQSSCSEEVPPRAKGNNGSQSRR